MTVPAPARPASPLPGVEVTPTWRLSRLAVRLAVFGALALVAGIVAARPEPVLVAAPCLVALVVALRRPRPETIRVEAALSEPRSFEDEDVEVHVVVRAEEVLGEIGLDLALPRTFEVDGERACREFEVRSVSHTWTVRARRWGRWRAGPLRLRVRSRGWGYVGTATLSLAELTVFPPPSAAREVAVPPALLARMGSHVARRPGPGVEFAGIRTYAPGDPVRRVNWPVSTRRGELYVNEYAAERAADVVAVVDTTVDLGPFGRSSLDLAVRGAATVVQAYLRYADRVGVVTLGGALRWLAPDVGTRQYYRIVETLLASRVDESYLEPELAHFPPQALPPGALAFVFTPLVDARAAEAVRDLRERGHPVIVVDVLSTEPDASPRDPDSELALRVWRLEREVLLHGLAEMGVTVLAWDEEVGIALDRVRLEPLLGGTR
ncbi:Uncharacterized conserved protein, DUF58 family, contains vWF domain [Actinopolymorpha cephalotaxi]|uniref:Uncharacterized conserved protein, DUF58 family, contains vWF domain n=1 Tax=Actinopolymorpha cephalotaxi TaxID=504797 RepID=A0A1I2XG35_9ACTN|nr:DUF58 domain-containing protein [Actinopolymorpha cephalotaxi]NYH86242.1 uncharacterized protein (DUF58 family) [Actinopolymorpha cephalotaxi]SFH12458.1 Uncharacterized conserved protein, DUF58 family, contains vWF domain [Actinopolymorpha cephalotaxi]